MVVMVVSAVCGVQTDEWVRIISLQVKTRTISRYTYASSAGVVFSDSTALTYKKTTSKSMETTQR